MAVIVVTVSLRSFRQAFGSNFLSLIFSSFLSDFSEDRQPYSQPRLVPYSDLLVFV
jgi:hypothetical protein